MPGTHMLYTQNAFSHTTQIHKLHTNQLSRTGAMRREHIHMHTEHKHHVNTQATHTSLRSWRSYAYRTYSHVTQRSPRTPHTCRGYTHTHNIHRCTCHTQVIHWSPLLFLHKYSCTTLLVLVQECMCVRVHVLDTTQTCTHTHTHKTIHISCRPANTPFRHTCAFSLFHSLFNKPR